MDDVILFDTIPLGYLAGKSFNVPDYQRGYRWGQSEIEALISDVMDCNNDKYCLQPLVVQYDKETCEYNLIDGQQRLTTIYIITQLAKADGIKYHIDYDVKYSTRPGSREFLKGIANCKPDSSNPDYHYISEAKQHIINYLKEKKLDIIDVYKEFEKKAQFIWYMIEESSEPIEMFQKLNMGKIRLTEAELIKATLLTRENHFAEEEGKRLGQERLYPIVDNRLKAKAREWDYIEQSLANDDFWYFLADDKFKDETPRIAIVLDAVSKDFDDAGSRSAFNVIYNDIKKYKDSERVDRVKAIWDMISSKHSLFCEWFEDDEFFHLIGFLVRSDNKTIKDISKETDGLRKSEIVEWLKNMIKDWGYLKIAGGYKDISDISYDDKKKDLRAFFLLFNVLTIMQTIGKDDNKKTVTRFPFEKYEKQKWDIEHIHAKADKDETLEDEEENSLCNLTLLDKKTNMEYKNASFAYKRDFIREKIRTDRFVPLCTQNVFFKVYTSLTEPAESWKNSDRTDYEKLKEEWAKIESVEEYRTMTDKWNELDWFLYEREIRNVIFDGFLRESGEDK